MSAHAIYCDESGGINSGGMTFAAVHIDSDAAENLLSQFRLKTGHIGELKGSRIDIDERGIFFELLEQSGAIAQVDIIKSSDMTNDAINSKGADLRAYNHLLNACIGSLLPRTGGCGNVVIDEGRYDQQILEDSREDIASLLGNWGKAQLMDSKRSTGVQIADVIANSCYNVVTGSSKARRIKAYMAPMILSHKINIELHSL